ncbi:hypothetical protein L210DRAFT_3573028, partial [Boletus edulis BED1]
MFLERRGQRDGPGWHYHRGRSTHLWNAPLSHIFHSTRKHSRSLVQTTRTHGFPCVPQQALSGLPMPLTISPKSMASRSRKPPTAQVARSPPAIAITKLNCWPCQTDRSLAMTGWAGIESFELQ